MPSGAVRALLQIFERDAGDHEVLFVDRVGDVEGVLPDSRVRILPAVPFILALEAHRRRLAADQPGALKCFAIAAERDREQVAWTGGIPVAWVVDEKSGAVRKGSGGVARCGIGKVCDPGDAPGDAIVATCARIEVAAAVPKRRDDDAIGPNKGTRFGVVEHFQSLRQGFSGRNGGFLPAAHPEGIIAVEHAHAHFTGFPAGPGLLPSANAASPRQRQRAFDEEPCGEFDRFAPRQAIAGGAGEKSVVVIEEIVGGIVEGDGVSGDQRAVHHLEARADATVVDAGWQRQHLGRRPVSAIRRAGIDDALPRPVFMRQPAGPRAIQLPLEHREARMVGEAEPALPGGAIDFEMFTGNRFQSERFLVHQIKETFGNAERCSVVFCGGQAAKAGAEKESCAK